MLSRRNFIKNTSELAGLFAIGAFIPSALAKEINNANKSVKGMSPEMIAKEEDFWHWVRTSYTVSPNIINLNNGGVSPQPKPVQDAHIRYYQMCNEGPSYYMWRILDAGREPLRERLAGLTGCSADEVAINRNATEALNTVIFGLNLKAGDEVIVCKQDYPNMLNAWKQREKRDGIKLVWLDFILPIEDDNKIVEQYKNAMTDRTKIVMVTHLINWVGQVMPVRKIADIAHQKGIEVVVDGAHSYAHLYGNIPELGCDYYGTALHKWLCAPFGSGLLYIKKEKIKNVWSLLSNDKPDGDDIRKFESLGTRSFASEMAIGAAIDFHEAIGGERKERRLKFLQKYWSDQVRTIPGVKVNHPKEDKNMSAIGNISIDGMKPEELDGQLFNKYKIHTVAINWENIHGVRVTPNVYTSLKDLDKLINAINDIAKKSRN